MLRRVHDDLVEHRVSQRDSWYNNEGGGGGVALSSEHAHGRRIDLVRVVLFSVLCQLSRKISYYISIRRKGAPLRVFVLYWN